MVTRLVDAVKEKGVEVKRCVCQGAEGLGSLHFDLSCDSSIYYSEYVIP